MTPFLDFHKLVRSAVVLAVDIDVAGQSTHFTDLAFSRLPDKDWFTEPEKPMMFKVD